MLERLGLCAVLLIAVASSAAAEVHKCVDPKSGRSTYQDSPCDGSMKGIVTQDAPKPPQAVISRPIGLPSDRPRATTAEPMAADASGGPEAVWQRFQAALSEENTEKALACILPSSRERYRSAFQAIGARGVRESVQGSFRIVRQSGPYLAVAELLRERPGGGVQSFEVRFARDPDTGTWYLRSF